jgi:hypothetical protein
MDASSAGGGSILMAVRLGRCFGDGRTDQYDFRVAEREKGAEIAKRVRPADAPYVNIGAQRGGICCAIPFLRASRDTPSFREGTMQSETDTPSKIDFLVCLSIQGPILPGDYRVGHADINVSYPDQVHLGLPGPIQLPKAGSTLFKVSWVDIDGRTKAHLTSKSFHRNLPIYDALSVVGKLLTAFKLVRVGHADGMRLRTVGISDTLFYTSFVDGVPTGDLNLGIRLNNQSHPWVQLPFDASGTTELARPHIDTDTYQLARRYVRCFELLEYGFYKETVIVAHAILDDIIQDVIYDQIKAKGLDDGQSRELLVRAIKESRFRVYLGPLLKILAGVSFEEIWSEGTAALAWLNKARNQIAHRGSTDDRDSACKAIFVSIKTVAALRSRGLVTAEFPPGMFRQARVNAAWTLNAESWVPGADEIETDPFD